MIYIYHHTDDDGYASAATVITYLILSHTINDWNSSELKLIPYNYTKLNTFVPYDENDFSLGDSIYLVDLSVSTGTIEKFINFIDLLYRRNCKFTWIDHHISSLDDSFQVLLNKHFEQYHFEKYIDSNYCAAYNCCRYLLNYKLGISAIPEIIRIIDDYDCWKLRLEGTKEFIVGFSLQDKHNPLNSDWYKWITQRDESIHIVKECIERGKIVNQWLNIDDTTKFSISAFETTFCGLLCCAINVRRNSDIFRTDKDYDIYLSYIYNGDNYIYSIYSKKEDVYCNKIAELFGGGGHKGAAGFTSNKLVVNKHKNLYYRYKDFKLTHKYRKLLKRNGDN